MHFTKLHLQIWISRISGEKIKKIKKEIAREAFNSSYELLETPQARCLLPPGYPLRRRPGFEPGTTHHNGESANHYTNAAPVENVETKALYILTEVTAHCLVVLFICILFGEQD